MTTKRFLSFFMALALVFSFMVFPAYAAEEATLGDLDGNTVVDSDDVVALVLYLTMPDEFPLDVNVDYTNDGVVDTDDAVALLLYVSMPDEFPLVPPTEPSEPSEPSEPAVESLVLGNNAVTLEAGDEDGAAWSYTADFTGNLKIDVAALAYDWEGNGEFYQVPEADLGFAFGRTYCMMVDGVEYHETSATVAVTEGQVLEIKLVSYYGYATQADLVLSEAKEDVGGEPIVSTQDVSIAAGDVDGETFTYTAQKDGALTVAVTSLKYDWIGEGEFTEVSGMDLEMGFGRMYCLTIDGVQYYQASATVNVAAGQTVEVTLVSAYGYATNATVTFTEGEAGSEPTEPTVPGEPDGTQDNPFVIEELPYSIPFFGGMDQYYVYTSAAAGNVVVSYLEGGILSLPNGEEWETDAEGNYVIPVEAGYELVLNPWTMQAAIEGEMVVTFVEGEGPTDPTDPSEPSTDPTVPGEPDGTADNPFVIDATPYSIPFFGGMDQYYVFTAPAKGNVVVTALEGGILSLLNGEYWEQDAEGNYVIPVEAGYVLLLNPWTMQPEISGEMVVTFSEEAAPELPMTPAEIVYAAYSLAAGESLEGTYTLTGVVTNINTPYDETNENISVSIVVEDMVEFPILCYRLSGEGADKIGKGDTVTVTGSLTNYKGTIEFAQGCTLDAWEDTGAEEILPETPVEIVYAAYSLAVGETLTGRYTLTGKIISIDTPYDEGYKNVSVTIVVEDMENFPIFCFRLKGEGADQITVGDIITATGVLKNYYGTIEFDAGCTLDAWERPSVEPTEPSTEPTEPAEPGKFLCKHCGEEITFTEWTGAEITESGHYYLANDVQLTAAIRLQNGVDVVVELNGNKITAAENCRVFYANGGTPTLSIQDSVGTGEITGGNSNGGRGGNIYASSGNVHIYGGKIYGGTSGVEMNNSGNDVAVYKGDFSVSGNAQIGQAYETGVAVFLFNNTSVDMADATITGSIMTRGVTFDLKSSLNVDKIILWGGSLQSVEARTGEKIAIQFTSSSGTAQKGVITAALTNAAEAAEYFIPVGEGYAIVVNDDNTLSIANAPEPTEPSEEPTEPSVEPTEPSVEPTEPSVEPTEPSVEPTEPSVEPTEPSVEPTAPSIPTVEFLVEGDNVVGLNGNDLDGETWTYTAQKNGTLTIEVTALKYDWMGEGEFTEASAMDLQMGFGRMYCLTVDAVQNYSYQVTVNVTAGQIVDVNLMSAYGYPTIATLTLTEAEGGAEVPTEPTVPGEPDGTQNNPFVIDALPYTINFFGGMDQYYTYTTTEAGNIVVTALEGGLLSLPNGEYWEQDEAGNYVIPVEAGYELVLNPWTMRPELEGAMVVSFAVPGAEPTEPSEEPTEPSEEPAPAPATYVFSDYKVEGELGGGAATRALDDVVTAKLSTGWVTSELRVYKNANVVFSSTVAMDSIVVNAGYKDSTFDVYVSEDGETWTLYQADVAYTSAYSDITIDLPDGCKNVQLVADMAQLRLKNMTVTFAGGSAPVEPTEPSQEPTEPSEEPTEPTTEPTEPSEEPTEPTTEPTEPSAPAVDYITEPVVDKAFKFRLVQKTAGKTLYLTGEMSGYYYATTENVEEAVDVYLEEVEGGYRVYFLKDGVKTYLEMAKSGTHNNVVFVTAPTKVLKWNAEIASVTCDLDGTDFYFGTYGTYKTFSASKISFVTGTGAATFDETNFVGHFVEVAEAPVEPTEPSVEPTEPSVEPTAPSEEPTEPSAEPTEPTAPAVAYVTEPVVGQAYKFMLTQKNLSKELYITGAMDGYYYATTEDAAAAVTVYFEEAEGGYYVYFVKEGVKNYMEIVASGTYKNVKFVTTPTKVLKWNAEIASVTCDVNGVDHYFGTYNTFKTFSASDVSRVTGDGAATMDVTNFVGHFYVAEGEAPVEPTEPSVEPTEPSVEPTEPSVEPTEPSEEPTEPSAPAAAAYNKITSIDQLVSGQYVLVVNSGYAPGVVDGTWITAAQPVVEGNQVTDTQGAVWTLNVTEQGVSLKDANGVFVAPKGGNSNGIKTGTEYFWAIEVQEDGTFRLVGTGSDTVILASNADAQYGNKFRGYKTTTVSGNAKTYPSFFTLYLFGEAEAPVEPTEPSVEPTEPSVEPTEPSEEPTEPSAPAVDYITEPVVDKAFKFRLVQKTAGKTLYLTGEMSGYYYATTENVEEAVDVYLEEVEGGYRVYFLVDGVKNYLEIVQNGTYTNVVFTTSPTKVLKWNDEIKSVTCDVDGTDYYFGTYKTFVTFSASKISYVTGTGAASFDETNFVGHFVEVAAEEEESKLLTWQEYVAMTGVEQRAYKESFENSADYYAWLEGAQAAYDAEHESVMDGVINLGDLVNKG